ncbi:hypothetical protein BPAE_0493g00030 [Botrytis paeoniae]|uniref:Altered inheritance of mitochondria protein 9, mitochondrial n=1 Tax=Botrytis paeoniae TaxID=278948 RepID=A0A4Z1F068_9HELO|nr:hypothetical protein BPAE_0493g00030 [Botrytis paeoniae]
MFSKLLSYAVFPRSVSSLRSSTIPRIQAPSKDPLFPFIYTSGRWLHRDKEQRALRRVDLQFQELCNKVLSLCPEASHIISYEKKEGGFNRVLIFLLDDGKRVVVHLPTRVAGPSALTTNSEVATIAYVKSHTTIPVPHIRAWSDDASNPIGSECIIMKHVEGVQLQERRLTMSGSQYTKCVQSACMTMKQLAALAFPAYGSIYFENAPFDSTLKILLSEGFCIRPYCSTTYWDRSASETEKGFMVSAGPSSLPTLLHADLHARNIYVSDEDPTLITCLIDWQSSSIEPAFIYANKVPDFAGAPEKSSEEAASSNEPSLSSQDIKMQKVSSYCHQAYEICMKAFIPKMQVARSIHQLLIRPFQYSHTSWREGATAVRQEFLDLAENRNELGLASECPYSPTQDELEIHQKEHKAFEHVQELKPMLIKLLRTDSDGWVPIVRWEEVRRAHKEVFDLALETSREAEDDSMNEKVVGELWPFDDDDYDYDGKF